MCEGRDLEIERELEGTSKPFFNNYSDKRITTFSVAFTFFEYVVNSVFCELDFKIPRKSYCCEIHIQYSHCSFQKVFT